jgi:hypothetical protein
MRVPLAVGAGELLEVLWVALVAGVGVTVIFSFVVLGSARSAEARRAGRDGQATVYAGFALLAFLLFAAIVAFGVRSMLAK